MCMLASTVANEADWMPDANLRTKVRADLGLADNEEITQASMLNLTSLDAPQSAISDLTGLEFATNLTTLVAWGNSISSLTPLTNLTALTEIRIGDCDNIADVTPLQNLTNLTKLGLQGNNISDVSALSGLVNLTWLRLVRNPVTDFSPLSGLKANITDVDITIPDPDTTQPTVSITVPSGAQNGAFDATITFTESVSNFVQGDVSLSGTATASITAWNTTDDTVYTATITPTTSGTVILDIAADVATDAANNPNTVAAQRTVTVSLPPAVPDPATWMPDANLRTEVRADLGLADNEEITQASMLNLTSLHAAQSEISDLTGLEFATNLTTLVALQNDITSLEPIRDLTTLTEIRIGNNDISDLQPLAGLTALTKLSLRRNNISDVSALSGLVNLTWLRLARNPVTDFSPLSGLKANITDVDITIPDPDTTQPTVSITVPSGAQNSAFDATITFSESISNFVQGDVSLSGTATASITDWNTTDDTVYTATITPTTSGTVTLDIAADVATDAANNGNTAATQQTVTVDIDKPSVTITVPSGAQNSAFDATITFSKTVSNFVQGDVSLSGTATASITDWNSTDDTVYTATITPTTSGTVTLDIAADVATDAANNGNTVASSQSVTVDVDASTVVIDVPSGTQNGVFNATITFSEVVSDFVQSELSVSGTASASITNWDTTDNTVFTAEITPTTSGTVTLDVSADVATDAANNPNTAAAQQTVTVSLPPAIPDPATWMPDANLRTEVRADLGLASSDVLTQASMLNLTSLHAAQSNINNLTGLEFATNLTTLVALQNDITSLEPIRDLTTLTEIRIGNNDISDLQPLAGLTALTKLSLRRNNISDVSALSGLVNLTWLRLARNPVTDFSPLSGLKANITDVDITIPDPDTTQPTVSITVPSTPQNEAFDATITFSEVVSDFVQTDVSLSGTATATITAWSANTENTIYTATVTPTASGTVILNVAAGVATDAAGNNNIAATSNSVTVAPESDTTPPSVRISVPEGPQNGAFDVTITFSEAVLDFEQADFSLNPSILDLRTRLATASITAWTTTDDITYTATVTPTTSGQITLYIASGVATDANGNGNTVAVKNVKVDLDPPSVLRIDAPGTRFSAQNGAFNVSIHVSEEVRFVPDKILLMGDANATIGQWHLEIGNRDQYVLGIGNRDQYVYRAKVTPTTSGTVIIWIKAGYVTDTAGNLNTGPTIAKSVSVDLDPPSVSILTPDGVQSGAFDVTIIFSEEDRITVLDDEITFQENDISFTGSTADPSIVLFSLKSDSHSTRNYIYNVRIKPSTSGDVVINIPAGVVTDAGTNRNTAATPKTVTVDLDKPTVTIGVLSGTQTGAFDATITFNEAVSGFALSDVSLNSSTASITGWRSNSENTVYTATITPIASGTVTISVPADVATDAAGNTNTAATPQTVTTAITNSPVTMAPTASISVPSDVQNGAFDVTVTFSESVSDFVQSELVLTGSASITSWSANTENTVFTATITPTVSGEITFNVNANVATNDAGNNNTAAAIQIVTVDMDAPSVTLALLLTEVNRSGVQITFTEPVDGFEHTDLSVTTSGLTAKDPSVLSNGQVINYPIVSISGWTPSQDGKTYTAYIKVNTTTEGQVIVNVPAGVATDIAGNINVAGRALNFDVNPQDAPPLIYVLTGPGAGSLSTNDGCHHTLNNRFDVNEDGSIDGIDVELVTNALGQFGQGIVHGRTDINCDDVVDNFDLLLLTDINGDGVVDNIDTALVDPSYDIIFSFPYTFPDKNLYLAIVETLVDTQSISLPNLPRTEWFKVSVSLTEIADLSSLDGANRGISDLTGLEYAYQLSVLNLSNNSISDISLLAELRNLTTLSLTGNPILDTSPLYPLLVANGGYLATIDISVSEYPPWDVNEDGNVDVTDSTLVTAALGQIGESIVDPRTDVNDDGTVDNADLTLVTENLDSDSGAPSNNAGFVLLDRATLQTLDREVLQTQLAILRAESDGSLKYLRAIALLESVLAAMRPEKTSLLANYPNPFNPETWIPYHLANPSEVVITIYDVRGAVVRRLELGHQHEGHYTSRSRAAYWDGRNDFGERVASGIYFYQLEADNMSLLRKMLILK